MPTSTFRVGDRTCLEVKLRYGWFRAYRGKGEKYWYVGTFFVERPYRGKGYARRLAKHLPARCMLNAEPFDDGLKEAALRRFYRSLGFKPAGGTLMTRDQLPRGHPAKMGRKAPISE